MLLRYLKEVKLKKATKAKQNNGTYTNIYIDVITYHVFIDENVLYAVNEDNNEKRVIFDKENVKNIKPSKRFRELFITKGR